MPFRGVGGICPEGVTTSQGCQGCFSGFLCGCCDSVSYTHVILSALLSPIEFSLSAFLSAGFQKLRLRYFQKIYRLVQSWCIWCKVGAKFSHQMHQKKRLCFIAFLLLVHLVQKKFTLYIFFSLSIYITF